MPLCGQGTDISVTPQSKSSSPHVEILFYFSCLLLPSHPSFYAFILCELKAQIICRLSVLNRLLRPSLPFVLKAKCFNSKKLGFCSLVRI